jgi:hypothetical protein
VLNTSSNVGRVGFIGASITGPNFVISASFSVNNNLRAQKAIGAMGAMGAIGIGEWRVRGNGQAADLFRRRLGLQPDPEQHADVLRHAARRSDGNRESLLFDFPAIKLSSGSPAVSVKNLDVMIDAGFQAVMHATLGYTMRVGRFWYLPAS